MPLAGESGLNVKTKIPLFCKIDLQEIIKFLIKQFSIFIRLNLSLLSNIKLSVLSMFQKWILGCDRATYVFI